MSAIKVRVEYTKAQNVFLFFELNGVFKRLIVATKQDNYKPKIISTAKDKELLLANRLLEIIVDRGFIDKTIKEKKTKRYTIAKKELNL